MINFSREKHYRLYNRVSILALHMGNVLPACETYRWNVWSVRGRLRWKQKTFTVQSELQHVEKSYTMHTVWFTRLLCKKCVFLKTLSDYQCDRNVTDSMTNECSQRQYGFWLFYRHWRESLYILDLLHFTALDLHIILQIISFEVSSKESWYQLLTTKNNNNNNNSNRLSQVKLPFDSTMLAKC